MPKLVKVRHESLAKSRIALSLTDKADFHADTSFRTVLLSLRSEQYDDGMNEKTTECVIQVPCQSCVTGLCHAGDWKIHLKVVSEKEYWLSAMAGKIWDQNR